MENQILDQGMSPDVRLHVNESAKDYLLQTSKWAKFLAILGFIFPGFMIVIGLSLGSLINQASMMYPMAGAYASGVSGFFIVIGLITLYPALRLFQFASQAANAVNNDHSDALEMSFKRIRSFFRFNGILMIIYLSLLTIAILMAVFAGGGSAETPYP